MRTKPMLGDWEIPRMTGIRALERRSLVEFPVPGRTGSLFQDLDANPTGILVTGSLYGDEARDAFLEDLRGKFRTGEPVTFVADVLTATAVQYVVIERLHVEERGDRPDEMEFLIVLRESPPPPPPSDPFGGLDAGLLAQAEGFLDTVTGALDAIDALGSAPDLGNPLEPLSGLLDGLETATAALPAALDNLATVIGEPEPPADA